MACRYITPRRCHVINPFILVIFAQKPRGLDVINRWKVTELRQFLLYTGELALKDIMREELYNHFKFRSDYVYFCLSTKVNLHNRYAQDQIEYYVEQIHHFHGPEFLVYNVHILIHVFSDAARF